jgi:putative FmdB family regulatory protein
MPCPALARGHQEDDVPTYAYACTACDHRFEVQQSFTDAALHECPQCEGRLRKLFNAVGIVFKGSGFYRTDSRGSGGSGGSGGSTGSSGSDAASPASTSTASGDSAKAASGGSGSSAGSGGATGTPKTPVSATAAA